MSRFSRQSTSEECTAALAAGLARVLRAGDVVALFGDLGAGKTTFVRALAAGMGLDSRAVSSPTYVMVNRYEGTPLALTHVDAYRLRGEEDVDVLGWDRLFGESGASGESAAAVEWAERIAGALPAVRAEVRIVAEGENERRFEFSLPDAWAERPGVREFAEQEPRRCPVTGAWVAPNAPTYPFANERARLADLGKWFTESHRISRPAAPGEGADPAS